MSIGQDQSGAPAVKAVDPQRRTLATTCAAHFVHDGIADALYVLLPIWAQAFGLSYVQVGTLRMAYSAAMACLQLPAGMLAERVGERALLAAGSVLAGVAFALLATSQSYAALGGLILLAGTGSAVQHPIASTLISRGLCRNIPARRARRLQFRRRCRQDGGGGGDGARHRRHRLAQQRRPLRCDRRGHRVGSCGGAGEPRRRRAARRPHPRPAPGWGFTDPTGFALLSAIQLIDSACRTGFLTFFPFLLIAKGASVASVGFGLSLVFVGGAAGSLQTGYVGADCYATMAEIACRRGGLYFFLSRRSSSACSATTSSAPGPGA